MKTEKSFEEMALQVIEQWKDGRSMSTTANYLTALRSFMKFAKGQKVLLSDIADPLLKAYEYWLRSEKSLKTFSKATSRKDT